MELIHEWKKNVILILKRGKSCEPIFTARQTAAGDNVDDGRTDFGTSSVAFWGRNVKQ